MDRRPDRDQRPRHERNRSRSRSPPTRERRDDRRRDRSPFRRGGGGGARGRGGRGGSGGMNGALPPRGRDRQPSRSPPPPSTLSRNSGAGRGNAHNSTSARRQPPHHKPEAKLELLEGEDEEAMLARVMGFVGFRSTKDTKVPGNDKNYAVSKVKKAEYRQYMNRVGGFNRPLSPTRTSG
ncbi:hypothetical protein LTR53_010849 [Teratosphaeriaceae sp. CCFEE 6253]|nr:hypothetical protein LTR53_010849 [Teratosphaeriaceae sp. CCFEE 6253]